MRLHNIPLAILSLLISLFLWVYVRAIPSSDTPDLPKGMFSIKVEARNIPPGFAIVKMPTMIGIRAAGTSDQINRVSDAVERDDTLMSAWVDLSKATLGQKEYPLQVDLPKEFGVVWQVPKAVILVIDKYSSRQLNVVVVPSGSPPEGFVSEKQEAEPQTVTVKGLQSELDRIDHATVFIDLSKVEVGSTMIGTVQLFDKGGLQVPLEPDPAKVTVLAALAPKPSVAKVFVNAILSGQPGPGFQVLRVDAEPTEVLLKGPSELLAKTTRVETKPIDISGIKSNRTFSAELELPDSLRGGRTSSVKVTVLVGPVGTIQQAPAPVPTASPSVSPSGNPHR